MPRELLYTGEEFREKDEHGGADAIARMLDEITKKGPDIPDIPAAAPSRRRREEGAAPTLPASVAEPVKPPSPEAARMDTVRRTFAQTPEPAPSSSFIPEGYARSPKDLLPKDSLTSRNRATLQSDLATNPAFQLPAKTGYGRSGQGPSLLAQVAMPKTLARRQATTDRTIQNRLDAQDSIRKMEMFDPEYQATAATAEDRAASARERLAGIPRDDSRAQAQNTADYGLAAQRTGDDDPLGFVSRNVPGVRASGTAYTPRQEKTDALTSAATLAKTLKGMETKAAMDRLVTGIRERHANATGPKAKALTPAQELQGKAMSSELRKKYPGGIPWGQQDAAEVEAARSAGVLKPEPVAWKMPAVSMGDKTAIYGKISEAQKSLGRRLTDEERETVADEYLAGLDDPVEN